MSASRPRRAAALVPAALLALAAFAALPGCGKGKYIGLLPANQRPEIELTQAPATATQPYFYAYEIRWAGFDADGWVDHYLYCVDPPTAANADTVWVSTTDNRKTFVFRSEQVDSATARTGHGYHTFVIKAVDNGGLASAAVHRSFNSYTLAPSVVITSPKREQLVTPKFGPTLRVSWKGDDPDGRTSRAPVKYKYKVFEQGAPGFSFETALYTPDSIRTYFGPSFSQWDSVGGDTTQIDVHDLTPGNKLFVLVAFDEAGAFSPVFKLDESMSVFQVTYDNLGPTLTVFNESFYYAFPGPQFSLEPESYIRVDLPADQPIAFNWTGKAPTGTYIGGYRWKLDGDLSDETPRTNEGTDIGHWSRWSALSTGCVIPPIVPPPGRFEESHFFYLEGKDGDGRMSLAVVSFSAIRPRFDRGLLIVDDTRLKVDALLSNGTMARPSGPWPTAAELDTFFFAAGGRPWRNYPAGTVSPIGAFQGYDYDTIGTRFLPNGQMTLDQLGRYRQVIWYVDYKSSTYMNPVDFVRDPMPFLHAAAYPGRSNPLALWIKQGGRAWLFGGGIAICLQREWEKAGSNGLVFANGDGELVPGRFMFDLAHWRSEISAGVTSQAQFGTAGQHPWPGMPDYSSLPPLLSEKTAATDPITVYAPNRNNQGDYYQVTCSVEALTKPNVIVQDANPDPNLIDMQPTLDTLYATISGSIGSGKPIMTLYHGGENQQLVFTGFPIWYVQRSQMIAMTDFVLQNLWGLTRRPVPR